MKKFTVRRRRDAYRDYEVLIEAASESDALKIAQDGCEALDWRDAGVQEFEHQVFEILDCDVSVEADR